MLGAPFGTLMVWIIILGLVGFAIWRFVQATQDADHHGSDAKGLAIRAGLLGSGVAYGALALFALGLVTAWASGSGGTGSRWIGAAYEAGLGRILVWTVAIVLLIVGLATIWKGVKTKFEKYFRAAGEEVMSWLRPLGRFGLIARGLTFLILSGLVFTGGLAYRSEGSGEAGGPDLNSALEAVQGWTFGWLILLLIAVGLLAFGIYSLAAARYRTVNA